MKAEQGAFLHDEVYHIGFAIELVDFVFIRNLPSRKFLFEILLHILVCYDRIIRKTIFVAIQQLEQITKDLGTITSVYFFDNKILLFDALF